MPKMRGKIKDLTFTVDGKPILSLVLNKGFDVQPLLDTDLDIEIKKHREKRSLNSNAYAWALIGKIADTLRANKEDVYFTMLKRYGQFEVVSVIEKGVDFITKAVKYCEVFEQSELNGKIFKHIKIYKGSSEFDTKEMAILIDGIVSECKDLGIDTLTPDEIAKMNARWGQ